jgi:hypothetical protein
MNKIGNKQENLMCSFYTREGLKMTIKNNYDVHVLFKWNRKYFKMLKKGIHGSIKVSIKFCKFTAESSESQPFQKLPLLGPDTGEVCGSAVLCNSRDSPDCFCMIWGSHSGRYG